MTLLYDKTVSLVENALASVARGNVASACGQLTAFINRVSAQSGKNLAVADADDLLRVAGDIKAALGCP